MNTYEFTIKGATPLIMHADDLEKAELIEKWQKDPANKNATRAADDRCPPWGWKARLYYHGGRVVMPSDNLMPCLRTAGAQFKMGQGKRGKTFKSETQAGLVFLDDGYPLIVKGNEISADAIDAIDGTFAEQKAAFEELTSGGAKLDMRGARPNTTRHIRVRPFFYDWSFVGRVHVVDAVLTGEILEAIFQFAGDKVGLGNWRPSAPSKPGPYGRFTASLAEV